MKKKLNRERYLELVYFCRQYNSKLKQKGNNTQQSRKAKFETALIEKAAEMARADIADYIVESVATGKSWEQLSPPCGRRQFYDARLKFFEILSEIK